MIYLQYVNMDILSMAIIYIDFYSLTCIKLPVVQIECFPESLQMGHTNVFSQDILKIYICV